METQDDYRIDTAEVASGGQSDSRRQSASTVHGPLPTGSMMTVRLSDSPVAPVLQTPTHDGIQAHNTTEEQSLGLDHGHTQKAREEAPASGDRTSAIVDEDEFTLDEDTKELSRDSTASMASIVEDGRSLTTASTIRSRSDSSSTLSSTGSAQVDWDELERSEEQAPRDEGSDEVGSHTNVFIPILPS